MKYLKLFEDIDWDEEEFEEEQEEQTISIIDINNMYIPITDGMNYYYTEDVVVSTSQAQCIHSL